MKKWVSVWLAMALCMVSAFALADITLTEVATGEDIDFIFGSSLLSLYAGDGGYHIITVDGEKINDELYGDSMDYEAGFIAVETPEAGIDGRGLIREDGTEVIPLVYGDIEILDRHFALGYKLTAATADHYDYTLYGSGEDAYALIDTVDVYSLDKGERIASFPRANFKDVFAAYGIINIENRADGVVTCYDQDMNVLGTPYSIYDTYGYADDSAGQEAEEFYKDGLYGLMDPMGNVLLKPSFDTIYSFYGDYAAVSLGGYEGLIDVKGNVIIPAEYDEIEIAYNVPDTPDGSLSYNAAGYFAVIKDGNMGYVNEAGEVTCEPKLSAGILENEGACATYMDMEGKFHLLAADGVDTVVEGYADIYPLRGMSGKLFRVRDEEYNYGVIDWHGNVLLPLNYWDVDASGDGKYLLADVAYDISVIFEVTDDEDLSASAAEVPAETQPAKVIATSEIKKEAGIERVNQGAAGARAAVSALLGKGTAPAETEEPVKLETPIDEAPAAAQVPAEPAAPPASSQMNTAAGMLVDTALLLLESDPAGNAADMAGFLKSANTLLGDSNASASAMISGAMTLIEVDAAANAASIKTLLETAKTML